MDVYEKIMALARRRGILYKSYSIYGGEAGFYDYGPIGSIMKNNIENEWRRYYILQEKFYEISTPSITPYDVLKASGHVDEFIDKIATCKKCGRSFKVEELKDGRCPICGGEVEYGELNLMFETFIGAKKKDKAFLRPETAQGIFVNFPFLYEFSRKKIPFGVVQIGKGFRNEVSPRQGILRLREFSMAEAEIFFHPENKRHDGFERYKEKKLRLLPAGGDEIEIEIGRAVENGIIKNEALAYYMALTHDFLINVGIDDSKIRFRQHEKEELAHYANDCWDAEIFMQRFGWVECVGIADRAAHDLMAHMKATGINMYASTGRKIKKRKAKAKMDKIGKKFKEKAMEIKKAIENGEIKDGKIIVKIDGKEMEITDEYFEVVEVEEEEKYIPHVIEPSYGIDRIFYAILEHNYKETVKEGEKYVLLTLPPKIAPIKAGVFPLVARDGLPEIAREIEEDLRKNEIMAFYDEKGSIGRRYARMDEIGTPFCITVDYQTKEDDTVTIRFRDTTEQIRLDKKDVANWIKERIK